MRALSYAGILIGSAAMSLLLTPRAMLLAVQRGLFDRPGGHKSHTDPVPYLGGLAIVAAFVAATGAAVALAPPPARVGEPFVILGLGMAIAFLGFLDDVKGLPRMLRLTIEVGAAAALYVFVEGVQLFDWPALNIAVTVLWVVGITNGVNLLDNMDGLAAGVAVIAASWFFAIAALNGQHLVASLAIGLAGCALGFLKYNRYPARIYMGDAGSLFLGFALAATGIKLRFDAPVDTTFFVPVLVLGVVILDTTLAVVGRIWRGENPLNGGRDHLSHRLVSLGMRVPSAVMTIHVAAVVVGGLALIMSHLNRGAASLLMGLVIALGLLLVVLLARMPVDEP